jgi:hypothetical protein
VTDSTERCSRWWGISDLDVVFSGGDRIVCPWPSARRRKGTPLVAPDVTGALLAGGPHLADVDPRHLRCTQTWVLHHHVAWYLTGAWERTGTTSADRGKAHNRYPLIHQDDRGDLVILAGHHRSMAALIEGRPIRARVLRPTGATAVAVLPHLLVGGPDAMPFAALPADDPHVAADMIRAGKTAAVPDLPLAAEVLVHLGLNAQVAKDRIAMAIEGRTLLAA